AMAGVSFQRPVVMILAAVGVIALLFFLPSTALGTISPVMAKYALVQSEKIGSTVGNIYASSAAGSIVGTFLSGFVLVPFLGIRTVVFVVAAVIALLSLLIRTPKKIVAGWMGMLAVLFFLSTAAPAWGLLGRSDGAVFRTDSMYSHIVVTDEADETRSLVMDGLVHNMYDPDNPDRLLYEYERIFESATNTLAARTAVGSAADTDGQLRTLTLGGGALTFPSYLERHYPKGEHHVVEIDPEVVETAFGYFDIPRDSDLEIHVMDARQYVLNTVGREEFDIIYLDVFNSYSIPYHLTTVEFTENLKRLLSDDGVLLVNLIDIFEIGKFLGAYAATAEELFAHTAVYADEEFFESGRSTFVLAATPGPADLGDLGLGPLLSEEGERFVPISEERIDALKERNRSRPLTDNHAPVENLIAPVFLEAARG
ncbi:MAG: fused MFS/spermidine synthase, partial [Spirochaetota bacterium]